MTKAQQVSAAVAFVEITAAIAETIRKVGPIPSGELYAQTMGALSLDEYQLVIGTLKRADLVSDEGHLLCWVGPAIP